MPFLPSGLPAEVLIDAVDNATGTLELMNMERYHKSEQMKTMELPYVPENKYIAFMLETFGRPTRNPAIQCDCERNPAASMRQVLSLANHPRIHDKIADPKGLAARVAKEQTAPEAQIEEVYLTVLSRLPQAGEKRVSAVFAATANRRRYHINQTPPAAPSKSSPKKPRSLKKRFYSVWAW